MPVREPESDLYAVLGVEPSATVEKITSAFRARVRELRPDTQVDAATAETFGEVRTAYETLRNPALRAAYDRRHHPPKPAVPAHPTRQYAAVLAVADPKPPFRAGPVRWIPGG